MTPESVFRTKAPVLMTRLLDENFGFSVEDVAAIAGNGGHESRGFTAFQEEKPTVKGSRGGWSWFQWTGPRRRAFEAFCKGKGLDLKSDEAAMAFLILELKGPEHGAVDKTKNAIGLKNKVVAFELGYERAGVKHYPERLRWAQTALEAYKARQGVETAPTAPETAPEPQKPATDAPSPKRGLLAIIIDLLMAIFGRKK